MGNKTDKEPVFKSTEPFNNDIDFKHETYLRNNLETKQNYRVNTYKNLDNGLFMIYEHNKDQGHKMLRTIKDNDILIFEVSDYIGSNNVYDQQWESILITEFKSATKNYIFNFVYNWVINTVINDNQDLQEFRKELKKYILEIKK